MEEGGRWLRSRNSPTGKGCKCFKVFSISHIKLMISQFSNEEPEIRGCKMSYWQFLPFYSAPGGARAPSALLLHNPPVHPLQVLMAP